ncbi:forkhead box protein P2-like isoform X2 [Daphnia carinata]|uniref:forkhead box protein P2-like isoform X2 n=1 Tax=Daphnia carinata TaxID=120202 RepID=UPI00286894E3|nr:forkhead box protein P2-like isoform X2 [Daphnia carinata]
MVGERVMDPETDVDGAINLSTHQQAETQPILSDQQTTSSPTLNHNAVSQNRKESLSPETKLDEDGSPVRDPANLPILSTSTGCSSSSDSSDSSKSSSPPVIHWEPSSLLAPIHKKSEQTITSDVDPANPLAPTSLAGNHPLLMTPQGLALQQHVQQLLRDQLIHPQSMLLYQKQQQEKLADLGRKQLETVMQQLQEQLQLNLIQQSQLMQQRSGTGVSVTERRKSNELAQTLAGQQQQLMQQLQLTQRHYLIGLQQQQLLTSPPASAGEEAPTDKSTSGWNSKESSTSLAAGGLNVHVAASGLPTVQVTACDSPASISPMRSSADSGKMVTNGHPHGSGVYSSSHAHYQQTSSTGDMNDNLIGHHHNGGVHSFNISASNGMKNGDQQRFSSSSSTPLSSSSSSSHPLFLFGVCRWPGCESPCDDVSTFLEHLNREHVLDDRSTAQTRVQMQVVAQLELQLQKERDRLQSMMDHLNRARQQQQQAPPPKQSPVKSNGSAMRGQSGPPSGDPTNGLQQHQQHHRMSPSLAALVSATMRGVMNPSASSHPHLLLHPPTQSNHAASSMSHQNQSQSRRRLSEKPNSASNSGAVEDIRLRKRSVTERSAMDISEGLPYLLDRTGLDVHQELQRNREFYRNTDVRPPFTYASLIRQAIIESPERQLTLNEIYTWFQNTFCYFRHNAATWKNAIRTNLSLHKCFVRYEDDFGSYWMVDDAEFVRRRHLARGRPRKFEIPAAAAAAAAAAVQHHQLQLNLNRPPSPHPLQPPTPSTLVRNRSADGATAESAQCLVLTDGRNVISRSACARRAKITAQGVQSKSPSMTPSPTLFGEALNASLQAALAESNMSFLQRSQSSSSQSPMDRSSGFHHHHHMLDGPLGLGAKRVKVEALDEELSSCSMKAPPIPSEEYYCRNPAGGSSLVVVKQQQHETSGDGGGNHSSGTDNEDNNDASSTENYEPLDFKAWRAQRSASNNTSTAAASNDEEDEEDDFSNTIPGRASITVEVGPASSTRLMDANSATTGSDFMTQTVRSAK